METFRAAEEDFNAPGVVNIGGKEIKYRIESSVRRKRIQLSMDPDGTLIASVPVGCTRKYALLVIRRHQKWVLQIHEKRSSNNFRAPDKKQVFEPLEIGDRIIDCKIVYSSQTRNLRFRADSDKTLTIRAPVNMPLSEIRELVRNNEKKILKTLESVSELDAYRKNFVSGEVFLFKGNEYRLKISKSNVRIPSLELGIGQFKATVPLESGESERASLLRPLFLKFYEKEAEKAVNKSVNRYINNFDKKPLEISVGDFKSRWGVCSGEENRIRINWRLILLEPLILDAVVVHELCHMNEKSHSARFWNDVGRIFPRYMEAKHKLGRKAVEISEF